MPWPPLRATLIAQTIFKRGPLDRHGVGRCAARFVNPTSQTAQSRLQVLCLFSACCRVLNCRFSLGHRALGRGVPACDPGLVPFHAHELGPEDPLGRELIVRTTPKSKALHGGRTTTRERLGMIELEEATTLAPVPAHSDEGATRSVALPHGASDVSGNVARGDAAGSGRTRRGRSRIRHRGGSPIPSIALRWPVSAELASLEPSDQDIQRAVEHLCDVSGRNGMAEQSLGIAQLIVSRTSDRDPDEIALRLHSSLCNLLQRKFARLLTRSSDFLGSVLLPVRSNLLQRKFDTPIHPMARRRQSRDR